MEDVERMVRDLGVLIEVYEALEEHSKEATRGFLSESRVRWDGIYGQALVVVMRMYKEKAFEMEEAMEKMITTEEDK
jgi:hypothetical protein